MRTRLHFLIGLMISVPFADTASAVHLVIQDNGVIGSKWSFDITIQNAEGASAQAVQTTLQIVGPGSLVLDVPGSAVVVTDPAYWVFGNSQGGDPFDKGSNIYQFGDGPDDGNAEALQDGDKVARYQFDWTTEGWYTININVDPIPPLETYFTDTNFVKQPLTVSNNGLQVYLPEPASVLLLLLGMMFAARGRRLNIVP